MEMIGVEKIEELEIPRLRHAFSERGFESLFRVLDALHDWASAGRLTDVTDLPPDQVVGWLEELIFTAHETIREIEGD
jgi:hypothetical protein